MEKEMKELYEIYDRIKIAEVEIKESLKQHNEIKKDFEKHFGKIEPAPKRTVESNVDYERLYHTEREENKGLTERLKEVKEKNLALAVTNAMLSIILFIFVVAGFFFALQY